MADTYSLTNDGATVQSILNQILSGDFFVQDYTYTGQTDANGFITTDLLNDRYIPLCGRCTTTDTHVEFTTGSTVWWMRVTNKGAAVANTNVTIKVWYTKYVF